MHLRTRTNLSIAIIVAVAIIQSACAADIEPSAQSSEVDSEVEAEIAATLDRSPDSTRISDTEVELAGGGVVLEYVRAHDPAMPEALDALPHESDVAVVGESLKVSLGLNVYVRIKPNERREIFQAIGTVYGVAGAAAVCPSLKHPIIVAICGAAGPAIAQKVFTAVYSRHARRPECGLELRVGLSSGARFIQSDSSNAC